MWHRCTRDDSCSGEAYGAVVLVGILTLGLTSPPVVERGQCLPGPRRYWLGEDGVPLPFRDDAEIKDFLRTAEVVDRRTISVGITGPLRVTLERDGIRADAVFRDFERVYDRRRMRDGRLYVNFTDSFRFEPAAYELACLLGMDNVPPAIQRRIGHRNGSLQLWVYGAVMENERAERRLSPPDARRWTRQRQEMILFDLLIGNVDRNGGNLLIDGNWNVWLIDHSRAFYSRAPYDQLASLTLVARDSWQRLRRLEREDLQSALGEHISDACIERLLQRRNHIVDHVEKLIAERGAAAVLYDAG